MPAFNLPNQIGAEAGKGVHGRPVGGGVAAPQEAGAGQDQGARADGSGPGGCLVGLEQPVLEWAFGHVVGLAGATRDEDDVGVRDVGVGGLRTQGEIA